MIGYKVLFVIIFIDKNYGGDIIQPKKLEDVAEILTGARLDRFKDGNIQQKEVMKISSKSDIEVEIENISNDINEKFYSRKGDIILQNNMPFNAVIVEDKQYIVPMQYTIIRPKENVNPFYLYYIFQNELPKKVNLLVEGSILKRIQNKHLKEMEICIHGKEIQEKLGKIFSAIEKRKNLNQKLIEIDEKLGKAILNNVKEE